MERLIEKNRTYRIPKENGETELYHVLETGSSLKVKDLKTNGTQFSWDLPADERYAKIIGDSTSEELIHRAVHSYSIMTSRLAAVESTGITPKRLRALRKLIKLGLVESYWEGLGAGGRSEFGVGRVRSYSLVSHATQQMRESDKN